MNKDYKQGLIDAAKFLYDNAPPHTRLENCITSMAMIKASAMLLEKAGEGKIESVFQYFKNYKKQNKE